MSLSLSEAQTRKQLIDKKLVAARWKIVPHNPKTPQSSLDGMAVEEYPTANGPADYALWVKGRLLGVVEAKKIAVGAQEVLSQAQRYSEGLPDSLGEWRGFRAPFLYSTNGKVIWHLDVRESHNIRRSLSVFPTPSALNEWFVRTGNPAFFANTALELYSKRDYQREAIAAFEKETQAGRRNSLIAMATGTGKTRTTIALIHRQLESKTVRRVLFLVDRRALAAQTVREFNSFETPTGRKFTADYEVFHQSFRREDMEDPDSTEKFDPNVLPESHLVNPDGSHTFVYVSTIQRMALNLFGVNGGFAGDGDGDTGEYEDARLVDIPSHAFDLIIADECHRGYTAQELGLWKRTLEHFDALKLGLTATPARHTVSLFGTPIYSYSFVQAVAEGHLCDFDAVKIESGVLMKGAFLQAGEQIVVRDRDTGHDEDAYLEDQREYDSTAVERDITVPDTNRKIVEELYKYALEHKGEHGRFPKTLIFAANDTGHTSHADQLVQVCREVFGQGDDFAQKITGNPNVDRPLQKIRQFRNRPHPVIVVTVDMLSTGVDIPALEWIVFLRPVKSRIMWEQMLGRGTRKCEDINKAKFTVFDCFGGTLISYFKDATEMNESTRDATMPIAQVVQHIWDGREKDYYTGVLVKRLQRRAKEMSGAGYEAMEAFGIPNGDLSAWTAKIPTLLKSDLLGTMKILRNPNFWDTLADVTRPRKEFVIAVEQEDTVSSQLLFRVGKDDLKPADYLERFAAYVRDNPDGIGAIDVIKARPDEWSPETLQQLRDGLRQHSFSEDNLKKATFLARGKALADVISLVKHAVNDQADLLTAEERVQRALQQVQTKHSFSLEGEKWLERIRLYLNENLSLSLEDFESPVFTRYGGLGPAKRALASPAYSLQNLVDDLNAALATVTSH